MKTFLIVIALLSLHSCASVKRLISKERTFIDTSTITSTTKNILITEKVDTTIKIAGDTIVKENYIPTDIIFSDSIENLAQKVKVNINSGRVVLTSIEKQKNVRVQVSKTVSDKSTMYVEKKAVKENTIINKNITRNRLPLNIIIIITIVKK